MTATGGQTKTYDVGDEVRIRVALVDADTELPVTPTAIACTILRPDGTTASVVMAAQGAGTGIYVGSYFPTVAGDYAYSVVTSGVRPARQERRFKVRRQIVP